MDRDPEGAKFCASCGSALSVGPAHCTSCGTELVAGAKFCPSCGQAPVLCAEVPCLAPELDGMDGAFDPTMYASLVQVEHNHFWFQARNELMTWLVRSHAADAKRVLEIGCGTGFVLNALRAACPSSCDRAGSPDPV